LQAFAFPGGRLFPEAGESEKTFEIDFRVVVFTAIAAFFVTARCLPQFGQDESNFREPVAHPGGKDRIGAGNLKPCQAVCQGRPLGAVPQQLRRCLKDCVFAHNAGSFFYKKIEGGLL
jgi:hypothetical protein